MNIDERLERLTERHEALTLNVELLTRDIGDLKKTVDRLVEAGERTDKRLNLLYDITLHIGADFAERLRRLEEGDGKEGEK
jgi:hypothetical protein